nr:hypothetical protein 10 [bacterium]
MGHFDNYERQLRGGQHSWRELVEVIEAALGIRVFTNTGPPSSGTSGTKATDTTLAKGDILVDTTNLVIYINEGSGTSPYWTPISFDQANLWGVFTDFRDQVGKALADTGAEAIIAGSGLRVFGQGVAETDSGLVVQAAAEGGNVGRITTTNEDAHVIAIGLEAGVMQPDQHGLLVIDVELTNVTAITTRAMFCGFLGLAADALDPAVTGATTVATLVQDDLAGLWFDTGLTDGDRLFGVHNKSNEAATQDLTADGDTSVDIAAAGTYQRLRVEINSSGAMLGFVDKAQVYSKTAALDADEECSPVLYLESNSAAVKSMDIRRIAAWAMRP